MLSQPSPALAGLGFFAHYFHKDLFPDSEIFV